MEFLSTVSIPNQELYINPVLDIYGVLKLQVI